MEGFGNAHWWWQTGVVYLLWGFLNYIIFFTIVYLIIPRFLPTRKYSFMVMGTVILIFLIGQLKYYFVTLPRFDYVFVSFYKEGEPPIPVYYTYVQYMQKIFFTGLFVSLLGYGWGLTINWFKSEKHRKELESKQLSAELSFLRMQVNPHFLFNSLNSIYSLALKNSEHTPEATLKLSEMMRYMLYETEDEEHKVRLDKEIDYLSNYIGLQKIRFSQSLQVEFGVIGNTKGKKIVPLILIPFVENGFKHGVLNDATFPLQIQIIIEGDKLIFMVKNKKSVHNKDATGGVGLENVKKRLKLLYPGKHNLSIDQDDEKYKTELTLFL